ncbi:MAG: histidine phosphatase family protein [Verrucomicrobia bacterium]|nr:histidine phosphatase family protein [Verrucomicrobiota bacterium]
MEFPHKRIYLIRHGETEWTLSGQHTGLTDIPLTAQGETDAGLLGKRLRGHAFETILYSPLQRASRTCEIAGLLKHAKAEPDLVEWNYGKYEGLTSQQILKESPHWNIFNNGAPEGETPADIAARANRVLTKIQSLHGDVALFSHGHFLRALTARWLLLPVQQGTLFALAPSSLSILGFEREKHVLSLWNDISHLNHS